MASLAVKLQNIKINGDDTQPTFRFGTSEVLFHLFEASSECRLVKFGAANNQLVEVGITPFRTSYRFRPSLFGIESLRKQIAEAAACLGEICFLKPVGSKRYEDAMAHLLLTGIANPRLHFVDIGIDGCNGHDVDDIADGGTEVDEVNGLVESHLDGADNLDVRIEHLQHLIG